ncbi:MerR family transcriptional regulator [Bifidobacterium phasiani]|uniref:MerR family transcriptional regulator n=1 Tax=Bifidobacterium phasiani TaxID=2834431 RepID=A0ABS6W8F3_9BIFI|nr:MerR family transcriptional regulator [Bifidobacterium phasiani]MBW3082475.1 MerR family transcriptional regulator [Bifidobacterium phasiani]
MYYTIGEVANATGIAISTLRYYDREGMFPDMERSSGGIRVFSDKELGTLKVVECLKHAGMSIKDIKEFLGWCQEGDATLPQRRRMFHDRLAEVERQMDELRNTMNLLRYKCWYYDTAVAAGTEDAVRDLPDEDVPEDLRDYRI